MDVVESSRKRSSEEAGHEQDDAARGGKRPDPSSLSYFGIYHPM